MNLTNRGQVLPMVLGLMAVLVIVVFSLVSWLQTDSALTVKQQKKTDAVNLAEAGIDRGTWKLQSATSTWAAAERGTVIAGYNFDVTYTDIPGGSYRIRFASGPADSQVTITAEGRDVVNQQTRAIQCVQLNQTIYSAMMSGGNITWSRGLGVFWGPLIAQGNIQLMDNYVALWYSPRKYAKGAVIGTATYPRDTNNITPPNTDNTEWWSNYSGIPNVPILDFAALRSSAAATGTLNVYGCRSTQGGAGTLGSATRWDTRSSCSSSGSHATHFGNPWSHPKSARLNPNTDYVWYWDGDVTLSGGSSSNQSTGLRGTVIVRGNLTIDTPGEYNYTASVPSKAWQQHQKLLKTTYDTSSSGEYPADTGYHQSASTFNFGTTTFCVPGAGCGWRTTVGIRGLTYVGGNLTILKYLDFHGAVWVNGSVTASGGTSSTFCGIFYNDSLEVPTLNVILLRQSWQEVPPSTTAWVP
ncbi:MAG: hypothetical protein WC859_02895 [Elusimicrobiota bacterium]|jgi:Tfp pilus assembly protein PilX